MAEQLSLIPTVKSTFRIPTELYRRLKIAAVTEGRPIADLLTDAIEVYLSAKSESGRPSR
jgi:predicted DNA-binding protein